MPLISKSINRVGVGNKFYEVGGVGRSLPISIFLLLGERGVNWWYGISCNILEIGVIKAYFSLKCCHKTIMVCSFFSISLSFPTYPHDNDFIKACIFLTPSKFFSLYFL